jgi:hypothetical protein
MVTLLLTNLSFAQDKPKINKCTQENDSQDCYQKARKFQKAGNENQAKLYLRKACQIANKNFHKDEYDEFHKDKKSFPHLSYCPIDYILKDKYFSAKSFVFKNFKNNLPDLERCSVIHSALTAELLPSYFWYRNKKDECVAQMKLHDDLHNHCVYPTKEVLKLVKNIKSGFELSHFWAKTNFFKGCTIEKASSKKLVHSRSELLSRLKNPISSKIVKAANNNKISNKRYIQKLRRVCKQKSAGAGEACYNLSSYVKKQGDPKKLVKLLKRSCELGFKKACSKE